MRIGGSSKRATLYRRPSRQSGRERERGGSLRKGFSLGGGTPGRRLLRLLVALVLVLLLMERAADPRVYRNFFAALGAPLKETKPVVFSKGPPVDVASEDRGEVRKPDALKTPPTIDEIQRVSDGTIWSAGDASVFYSLLACAQSKWYVPYGTEAQFVGYGALADQGDWYRGKTVALHGQAVRCEPHQAKQNEVGIERYWLVWLRPLDGSDRPVMVYVAELPTELQKLTQTGVDLSGPEVLAQGVYLRRHLYQADKGSQLAPVIVGHVELLAAGLGDGNAVANASGVAGEGRSEMGSGRLVIAIVLAAVVGLGGGIWLMVRTLRSEREQRTLRRKSQKVVLEDLPKLLLLALVWSTIGGISEPLWFFTAPKASANQPTSKALRTAQAQPETKTPQEEPSDAEQSGDESVPATVTSEDVGQEIGSPKVSAGAVGLLELLPGFDSQRLMGLAERLANTTSSSAESQLAVSEAAKLIWAFKRLPENVFVEARATDLAVASGFQESTVGEPILGHPIWYGQLEGTVQRMGRIDLVAQDRELLEMDSIALSVLAAKAGVPDWEPAQRILVLTDRSPVVLSVEEFVGQDVVVEGLAIRASPETTVVFAGRVRRVGDEVPADWPTGWKLLDSTGFDCRELMVVASNMRRPLKSDESRAFYGVLAAADKLGRALQSEGANFDGAPMAVGLDLLLRSPEKEIGAWIELDLETVRLTRVVVDKPEWRALIGRDHYWQIDTFGTLPSGLRIELPVEGKAESLTFQNRFPVSVVAAQLPSWLEKQLGEGLEEIGSVSGAELEIGMRMLRAPVGFKGFFYRLWSYQSEFVDRAGGRQIAPLLIAAELESLTPAEGIQENGAAWIGWVMGTLLLVALAVTAVVLVRAERKDTKLSARRRQKMASEIDLDLQ